MSKLSYKHTIFASYGGYITQAVVNNLAPLLFTVFRSELGLSLEKITFIVTVNFAVQLLVDLASTKFVDKIGYKPCIMAAHIFCALGLAGMSIFPYIVSNAYAGLMCAVVIYALGGGLIEVLISPIVEACPTDNKASAMSLLHSFYCWGTVFVIALSTLFLSFAGRENWRILALFWAVFPFVNAVYFYFVPINTLTADGEGMTIKELFSNKAFWLFIILMITAGASEQSMSQWASSFAESGLGISKTAGDLAGPCMFALLMGISRAVNAKIAKKVSLHILITVSGCACIVTYIAASLCSQPLIGLAGCALCGLTVGVMWPGTFSLAGERFPKGGTAMFALLALAGDLGCSAGPTLVGQIASAAGDNLKTGILSGIVFPVTLVICCLIYLKQKNRTDIEK